MRRVLAHSRAKSRKRSRLSGRPWSPNFGRRCARSGRTGAGDAMPRALDLSPPSRRRLPNRRPAETRELAVDNVTVMPAGPRARQSLSARARWMEMRHERSPNDVLGGKPQTGGGSSRAPGRQHLCAGCGKPVSRSDSIPLPHDQRVHDADCLTRFGRFWLTDAAEALAKMGIAAPEGILPGDEPGASLAPERTRSGDAGAGLIRSRTSSPPRPKSSAARWWARTTITGSIAGCVGKHQPVHRALTASSFGPPRPRQGVVIQPCVHGAFPHLNLAREIC